jgi:hypothetical protein
MQGHSFGILTDEGKNQAQVIKNFYMKFKIFIKKNFKRFKKI